MASYRERAAIHEAGHAAAMLECDALNGPVQIDGHGNGSTRERKSWLWNTFHGELRGRDDELRVSIAGCLVESRYYRGSVEKLLRGQSGYGGYGDGDRVWAALNGDPLSHWVRRTEKLLRGYERRMERLADALLDTGWVDGDVAREILMGRR